MSTVSTTTVVSISQYLDSSYRPDREYIDGELIERNIGEREHSNFQMMISSYLYVRRKQLGIVVLPEQRVQVSATRFRVPGISVVAGPMPSTHILREPPFLCIEILSPEDSMRDMQERVDDYIAFGVPNVWVVDPRKPRAFQYTPAGILEVKDGILRTTNPDIEVPLPNLEDL